MRLIVTGFAQHGKDTACEILRDKYGLKFVSSSYFVAMEAVLPWFQKRGRTWNSLEEMYADRIKYRPEWKQAISEYNTPDAARLGKRLFGAGNDIYCGLRDIRELAALTAIKTFDHNDDPPALKNFIDATVWVDALRRMPPEPSTSITIRQSDCQFTLNNNGTLADLERNVDALWAFIKEGRLA